MRSTFHSIETAKRALFTQQAAIQTTGHNIANANTPGYSRQIVNMQATRPIEAIGMSHSTAPGQLGTGVEFTSITRIREQFLDSQYRNQNMDQGKWSIQADTLDKLESIFNEPNETGIRTLFDNYWKAWSDLAKDPENVTGRKVLRENAVALADSINLASKQLSDLSGDLTDNISVKVNQINTLMGNIANLNQEIARISAYGDDPNDLKDQRDLLTDQLSKIVNITVTDTPQGYNISMGGTSLVTGQDFTAVDAAGLQGAFGTDLTSGEIYGMIQSRDRYVKDYQTQLDTLANSLANGEFQVTLPAGTVLPDGITLDGVTYTGSARTLSTPLTVTVHGVNELHRMGYPLQNPPAPGVDFFVSSDGGPITAAALRLNPVIANSPDAIATSMRTAGTPEKVVPGNNTLALLMANLKDTKINFVSPDGSTPLIASGTIDDYYRALIGQLGVQSEDAHRQVDNQDALLAQIDERRQSVSGVSLDEEMSDLIKFQHAYNAAARCMTTFDEMLDRIINSMGTVGR
ncbi:flagellar hook-associated protein FlgK [Cohnella sp. CFH 77786]|uniref:flagellar hook-associated protein FlgK n=1 Tax=Cohnella sp. CFH 77786 TaxID=2662265 RepID=UPI001C60E0DB|nr:flagellar hook-associated protein FlgK [Cohnella sp. CFH 77786]MBW5448478.1 flagellar hook-associated protein FlgK [Cohnella sp. CFH 77786]